MGPVVSPETRMDWTSPVGQGCKLELAATIDGLGHRLVSLVADSADGSIWVELYPVGRTVQIPLATIIQLLEAVPELQEWHRRIPQDSEVR